MHTACFLHSFWQTPSQGPGTAKCNMWGSLFARVCAHDGFCTLGQSCCFPKKTFRRWFFLNDVSIYPKCGFHLYQLHAYPIQTYQFHMYQILMWLTCRLAIFLFRSNGECVKHRTSLHICRNGNENALIHIIVRNRCEFEMMHIMTSFIQNCSKRQILLCRSMVKNFSEMQLCSLVVNLLIPIVWSITPNCITKPEFGIFTVDCLIQILWPITKTCSETQISWAKGVPGF